MRKTKIRRCQLSNILSKNIQVLARMPKGNSPTKNFAVFLGRNFFHLPFKERKNIKILEVGCGSGGNLWAIAREGFSGFGVDISPKAIELCRETLASYGCSAELFVTDMINLPLENEELNAVVDVFSVPLLNQRAGKTLFA